MTTTETLKITTTETFVKMILDRWYASIKSCDTLLNSVSDEQLQKEVAPNRNRGLYILGHLIAVHDDMIILLNMGAKLYPGLKKTFLDSPDKSIAKIPTAKELRENWSNQCKWLKEKFERLNPEDWFEKHTAVSSEDFAKEPHRNKLNIIVTRTSHLQYHIGQLVLLKSLQNKSNVETSNFTTTIMVDKSPEEVFNAVNNVGGWWQGEVEGSTNKLNDEFVYRMEDIHYSKQKIVELIPNEKVVWLVTESKLNFIKQENEWNGSKIIFDIAETGNKTQLRFTHIGLNPAVECYENCSSAWGLLVQQSLLSLITTGEGKKVF